MKKPSVVEERYMDSDGYWVVLKPGYQIDGCHGWREDTAKKLSARIKDARPCNCEDCK